MPGMDKAGRNDPCPCGSGKKYKNCHLGKTDEVVDAEGFVRKRSKTPVVVLAILGLVVAVAAGFWKGPGTGAVFGIAAALFLGGYSVLRNPPPRDPDAKDAGSINFGR